MGFLKDNLRLSPFHRISVYFAVFFVFTIICQRSRHIFHHILHKHFFEYVSIRKATATRSSTDQFIVNDRFQLQQQMCPIPWFCQFKHDQIKCTRTLMCKCYFSDIVNYFDISFDQKMISTYRPSRIISLDIFATLLIQREDKLLLLQRTPKKTMKQNEKTIFL